MAPRLGAAFGKKDSAVLSTWRGGQRPEGRLSPQLLTSSSIVQLFCTSSAVSPACVQGGRGGAGSVRRPGLRSPPPGTLRWLPFKHDKFSR